MVPLESEYSLLPDLYDGPPSPSRARRVDSTGSEAHRTEVSLAVLALAAVVRKTIPAEPFGFTTEILALEKGNSYCHWQGRSVT